MAKKATIFTNDPKVPKQYVKIKGKVESFAAIKPKYVRLHGQVGKKIEAVTTIAPTEKYPFKILKTRIDGQKDFSYELSERDGEKPGWRVRFKNLKETVGTYKSTFVLETDSSVKPEIRIDVNGNIRQRQVATISPRSVLLRGPANKPLSQKIRIVPLADSPFEITEIKADKGEHIRYEMAEDEKDGGRRHYVVTVENQQKTSGRYFDILRMKTTSEHQPELKITITGIIQKPVSMEN